VRRDWLRRSRPKPLVVKRNGQSPFRGGGRVAALASFGLELDRTRSEVARIVGMGDEVSPPGTLPLTPRMETIIELSKAEAQAAGMQIVGTEHLLLGLAREGNGVANVILWEFGVTSDDVRERVIDFASGPGRRPN
jgi:ATP-dependent Clp protease ATP-binding subunit ClpC